MPQQGPHWEANLAAVEACAPGLSARLRAAPPARRAHRDAAGVHWRPYRRALLLQDDVRAAHEAAQAAAAEGRSVLLVGVGAGQALVAMVGQTQAQVVVWEDDLSLLQEILGHEPLAPALASGQLELVVGPDLLAFVAEGRASGLRVHVHPQLARYRDWLPPLLDGLGPVALVVSGELLVADVGRALRASGWREYRWDRAHLPPEERARAWTAPGVALVVAVNTRTDLCEEADENGVPVVIWEIDPTTDGPARLERPLPRAAVFTYRRANLGPLKRAGYGHVHHLPLATDPARMAAGVHDEGLAGAVAFVGASMVDNARQCMAQAVSLLPPGPRLRTAVERALQVQLQDLSRWMLPTVLDQLAPGLRARVAAAQGGLDLALLLGEHCASLRRLQWLAPLRDDGLVVWGDRGWEALARIGVDWRGPADHFRDLPRIYRSAAINVDIGRLYQLDIVTMRVFDVLAAGGFLLAEHSPGLAELFAVGVELDTWRTPAELRAKVRHYRQHPRRCREIAKAGQERVRRDHSIAQRVAQIGRTLGLSGFSPTTPPPGPDPLSGKERP